jgi:preprotein translocase subunit SecG
MNITSFVQLLWSASAVALIALVLLHSPKGDGIGGIGGQAQLFTSAKTAETTLNRVTWTLFVAFVMMTIVLSANWLPTAATAPANPANVSPLPDTNLPDLVPENIPPSAPAVPEEAPN